jgi:hypothetical protein
MSDVRNENFVMRAFKLNYCITQCVCFLTESCPTLQIPAEMLDILPEMHVISFGSKSILGLELTIRHSRHQDEGPS